MRPESGHEAVGNGRLARALAWVVQGTAWLVLPLSALLFLQWPLRELVQAYSRQANDLAQILFALYASVAITAATRARTHLAAEGLAYRGSPRRARLLARLGALAVLMPWSAYLLVTAAPLIASAVAQWEGFPETFHPGYFLIKIAVGVLGALVALQAWIDATAPGGDGA